MIKVEWLEGDGIFLYREILYCNCHIRMSVSTINSHLNPFCFVFFQPFVEFTFLMTKRARFLNLNVSKLLVGSFPIHMVNT